MQNRIFVGNLDADTSEATLRDLFTSVGVVLSVTIRPNPFTGLQRGVVEMSTAAEAGAAIRKFAGYRLGERQLFLGEYRGPTSKTPR